MLPSSFFGGVKRLKILLYCRPLGPARSWGWWEHLLALHRGRDKERNGVLSSAASAPGIKYLNPDTRFSWNNHTMVSEARSQSGAAQAGAACAGSSGQAGLLPGLVRGGRCTRRFNAHLDEQRPKRHKGGYICGCKSGTGCKTLLPGQGGEQRPAMPCKDSRGWMHTRLLINTPDTHYKKNQAEPQLNTNCKPSRWRGERQGPPTLLAE